MRPQDIDNTLVISLIGQKMPMDDFRVWARNIYVQKLERSMTNLLRWMDEEMTARLRSGAAVRKTGNLRSSVDALNWYRWKRSRLPRCQQKQKFVPLLPV